MLIYSHILLIIKRRNHPFLSDSTLNYCNHNSRSIGELNR